MGKRGVRMKEAFREIPGTKGIGKVGAGLSLVRSLIVTCSLDLLECQSTIDSSDKQISPG